MTVPSKELITQTPKQLGFVEKMIQTIDTLDKATEFGDYIIKAGFAPKHFEGKPQAIVLAIDGGTKIGLDWWQSLWEGYVVNGTPGYKARALKGLVLASGECIAWDDWFEGSIQEGTRKHVIEFKTRRSTKVARREYSMDTAKLAKLWGPKKKYNKNTQKWEEYDDAWVKHPDNMLESRNISNVCNTDFPHITKGFKTVEELQDYPVEQEAIEISGVQATAPNSTLNDAAKAALSESRSLDGSGKKSEMPPVREEAKPNDPHIEDATIIEDEKQPKSNIYTLESMKDIKGAELLRIASEMIGIDVNAELFNTEEAKKKRTATLLKKMILAVQDGMIDKILADEFGYVIKKDNSATVEETGFMISEAGDEGRAFDEIMQIDSVREAHGVTDEQIMSHIKEKGLNFTDKDSFFRYGEAKDILSILNPTS